MKNFRLLRVCLPDCLLSCKAYRMQRNWSNALDNRFIDDNYSTAIGNPIGWRHWNKGFPWNVGKGLWDVPFDSFHVSPWWSHWLWRHWHLSSEKIIRNIVIANDHSCTNDILKRPKCQWDWLTTHKTKLELFIQSRHSTTDISPPPLLIQTFIFKYFTCCYIVAHSLRYAVELRSEARGKMPWFIWWNFGIYAISSNFSSFQDNIT